MIEEETRSKLDEANEAYNIAVEELAAANIAARDAAEAAEDATYNARRAARAARSAHERLHAARVAELQANTIGAGFEDPVRGSAPQ